MGFRHWLVFLTSGILFLPFAALAQEKCAFDYFYKQQSERAPGGEKAFESWMAGKIRQRQTSRTQATFNVPVVVHIIHNGEAVGVGSNLSVAQVQSQIDVLNKDYKRLNDDRTNTPPEFAAVAGSVDVNFILAKQDPEGLPTNGIARVQGTKTSWSFENGPDFKALSYWPAEDYLNIWVTTLAGDYLGFAQFPQTSLPGTDPPYDRLTDGVAIDYRVFGTVDEGSFNLDPKYNKGRTTTHEVGHFFSMLHIFGNEGGCNTTDFVDDTPVQSAATLTCPTHPSLSCSHPKMFQNYMDYTDDACMNLFTAGQVARMVTVLQNSPRRTSLNTSHGLLNPVVLTLDLEARRVVSPLANTCGQQIIPAVELRNRGTTVVTSAQIQLLVDGGVVETKNVTLNMAQLALTTVTFNPIDLPEPGNSNVSFQIVQVNGTTDNKPDNNSVAVAATVIAKTTVPFTETFNTFPATWQIVNFDNNVTWVNTVAPKSASNNRAMFMEFFNYENTGSKDRLVSNYIAVPATGAPVLKFDRAYARFPNNNSDVLRVLVSSGCSADISTATEIYNKSGANLATAGQSSAYFTPSGESQWATENISLAAYKGQNIQVIFETTNGFGNNLYLDNVSVSSGDFNDIAITSLVQPGPVFCLQNLQPIIQVQNLGSAVVNRINVSVTRGGSTVANQVFQGLSLTTGASANLTLPSIAFNEGRNSVTFVITNPDVVTEESPQNNTLVSTLILNQDSFTNPLRINLDNGVDLSVVSQNNNPEWQAVTTNFGNSLMYPGYTTVTLGAESWAVTPAIDFRKSSEASMFFDTSYGRRNTGDERLRVLVSEDCGLRYDSVIFDMTATSLSNKQSDTAPWTPTVESDWTKHYLSLSYLAGKDQIRFAFVASNGHGNNLYLDNLEWFVEDDPSPPRITDFYSVYSSEFDPYDFFITFNLAEKLSARLAVYNTMGQILIDNVLPETLNQTYTVNLSGQSTGVYLVRLQAGSQVSTTKLFVGR
jgi:hypothetical protein